MKSKTNTNQRKNITNSQRALTANEMARVGGGFSEPNITYDISTNFDVPLVFFDVPLVF